MSIKVLPEDVASAIAAGEVVERPASVVKELVENAIDAGARRIDVVVESGGRELVQVADDGQGIPSGELALAVARYATSKLQTAQDLFEIGTLGFRGEALSSIGAVSRLEITTQHKQDTTGSRLRVEGGKVGQPKSVGAPEGTVVSVRDLFFNVPARMEFMRAESTERRHISTLVTRYALAYPRIAFSLEQEGRLSFQSSGNGNRLEVAAAVYGLEIAQSLMALHPMDPEAPIQIDGYISPPSVNRSNRNELTFYVNGRWVQDSSLSAAVLQAYHTFLMVGRYPLAILFIEMPPEAVDVNVHPAKTEVRFRQQGAVFSAVQRVVRATLLGQVTPPQVELGTTWSGVTSRPWSDQSPELAALRGLEGEGDLQPGLPVDADMPLLRSVGQVGASYLVAEGPDGLYLIDQHAAHERILFEALMAKREEGELHAQALLEPEVVELTPAQFGLIEGQLASLRSLGFDVEVFGQRAFKVRAIPELLTGLAPADALRVLVEDFEEDEDPLAAEIEKRIAARVCKRAAVKAGQVLSMEEQRNLIRQLEGCASPRTCPHGRPT
ncbi:MAG: DNA mismatch repair endonuclease MutL, partial [Anaerolineales bacterium]